MTCPDCAVEFGRKKPRSGKRTLLKLIFVLIIVGAAVIGIISLRRPAPVAPIETLIPEKSCFIGVSDADWLWKATTQVRVKPQVSEALQKSEEELGVSLDKDVLPWMGQFGFVFLGMTPDGPQSVLLGEVKDDAAFKKFMGKARDNVMRCKLTWKEVKYHGVKLQQTEIVIPRKDSLSGYLPQKITVQVALLGKWFVAGFGKGSAEKIIDTWEHKTLSISQSPQWSKSLAELRKTPGKSIGWVGFDGESCFHAATGANPFLAFVPLPELLKTTTVCGVFETPDELKISSIIVPNSDKSRKIYKELAQVDPVSGKSLQELPDNTFAAIASTASPAKAVNCLKEYLMSAFNTPEMSTKIQFFFLRFQPIIDALQRLNGESAVALTWKDDVGFGGVFVGQTDSAETAKATAGDLRSFAQGMGLNTKVQNGLVVLPDKKSVSTGMCCMPCWGANEQWLKFGSHPSLISATGETSLKLPSEADDSILAGAGDFGQLVSTLDSIKSAKTSGAIDELHHLGLDKASWAVWTKADRQSGSLRSTIVIRNWDWHKAVAQMAD